MIWCLEMVDCFSLLKQLRFFGIQMLKIIKFARIRFQILWYK